MKYDTRTLIDCIIELGKQASNKALIWANSGNISHRLDDNKFVITGSGAYLEKLSEVDFVLIDLEDGTHDGEAKPSLETKIHTQIYKRRDDVMAVFHSQPFFTTLISCTHLEVDNKLFPESMAYIDKIERISYHHPGSRELAESVSEKIVDCNALILSNHGAICVGDGLEDVLLRTETLEMLCRIIAFSKVGKMDLNFLPQGTRKEFLEHLSEMK